MDQLIAAYLFQHQYCPLGRLGSLSVLASGATSNITDRVIAAPQPLVRYSSTPADTAPLARYIASVTHEDQQTVDSTLDGYIAGLGQQLDAGQPVQLGLVGEWYTDPRGELQFRQIALPGALLPDVKAERVIHPDAAHNMLVGDKETTTTVMTEYFNETPAARDRWWIWALLVAAAAVTIIIIYMNNKQASSFFGNATGL